MDGLNQLVLLSVALTVEVRAAEHLELLRQLGCFGVY